MESTKERHPREFEIGNLLFNHGELFGIKLSKLKQAGKITKETLITINLDLTGVADINRVRGTLYQVKYIIEQGREDYQIDLERVNVRITRKQYESRPTVSGASVVNAVSPFRSRCEITED